MTPEDNVLFRSFGREAAGRSILYKPETVDDVLSVFGTAKRYGQRIAIRAGGHSFHDQALHNGDTDRQIVLSSDSFNKITFAPDGDPSTVRLGAGVKWIDYFNAAIDQAKTNGGILRLPGSMQTGRSATAGGTMAGDCLSRFSAVLGKESFWIQSFDIVTPGRGLITDVSRNNQPDLFYAAVGGHGYLGFVTDVTYKLVSIDSASCARTKITTYESFTDLVAAQLALIDDAKQSPSPVPPRAISSVWFTDPADIAHPEIKGGVFDSSYALPSSPPSAGFPVYGDIDSHWRYVTELLARHDLSNLLTHQLLYDLAKVHKAPFENDLMDFLFFMDGNTVAKTKFEAQHYPQLFPIVQQTFVISKESAVSFARDCESKMSSYGLRPTETDMLFVAQDDCLMSANYHLDGFAITLAFEPIAPDGKVPDKIQTLLRDLSVDCQRLGGRIHLVKNIYSDPIVFRQMFHPQIEQFEDIKRTYDPDLVLRNGFSDTFFVFK